MIAHDAVAFSATDELLRFQGFPLERALAQLAARIEGRGHRPTLYHVAMEQDRLRALTTLMVRYEYESLADEPTRDLRQSIGQILNDAHAKFDLAMSKLSSEPYHPRYNVDMWRMRRQLQHRERQQARHRIEVELSLALHHGQLLRPRFAEVEYMPPGRERHTSPSGW